MAPAKEASRILEKRYTTGFSEFWAGAYGEDSSWEGLSNVLLAMVPEDPLALGSGKIFLLPTTEVVGETDLRPRILAAYRSRFQVSRISTTEPHYACAEQDQFPYQAPEAEGDSLFQGAAETFREEAAGVTEIKWARSSTYEVGRIAPGDRPGYQLLVVEYGSPPAALDAFWKLCTHENTRFVPGNVCEKGRIGPVEKPEELTSSEWWQKARKSYSSSGPHGETPHERTWRSLEPEERYEFLFRAMGSAVGKSRPVMTGFISTLRKVRETSSVTFNPRLIADWGDAQLLEVQRLSRVDKHPGLHIGEGRLALLRKIVAFCQSAGFSEYDTGLE